MEKQVIVREYQEALAGDIVDVQEYARSSVDHLVNDAVTATRRYSGFGVAKSSQAEVTVAPGRFYDQGGAIYNRSANVVQNMLPYLASAAKRIVVVAAYGVENEVDVETRDFVIDVDLGTTEPRAVAMTKSRDAVLSFIQGTESADPQPPAIPITHVAVAYIYLDASQVTSITMLTDNAVQSTEALDVRTDSLEAFRAAIEPRVSSLASDLAALANKLATRAQARDLSNLYIDMARVKELLEVPDTASDYGADRFLTTHESDVDNSQNLGYDAWVEEGIRFPFANENVGELSIFSANDPNARVTNGLLLPAFDSVLRMAIGPFYQDQGIAQYGFQTYEMKQMTISRQRIRYGSTYTYCTNSQWWQSGTYDSVSGTFTRNGETFTVLDPTLVNSPHTMIRLQQYWIDTYNEDYWDLETIDHTITGAQVSQTFLVGNDFWLSRVGFYVTVKAANENVFLSLCECTNGQPDLEKVILHQVIDHASIIAGDWTRVNVMPTFLHAGKRYAVVLTSNANHKIGMASGQNYLEGTFFMSTDGAYQQGDLTKDMMLELWSARFAAPQVAIELNALNLDGGIRNIDILAGIIAPGSTQLLFEVQPGGTGAWIPLTFDDLSAFAATPPLVRFRARCVGTRDVMPGLMLTGSEWKLSRPKTAFTHISKPYTLSAPADSITLRYTVESFNETPHDFSCRLRVGATWETPDTTVDEVINAADGRLQRTYTFDLAAPTSAITIETKGTTNSANTTFHVAERIHYVNE